MRLSRHVPRAMSLCGRRLRSPAALSSHRRRGHGRPLRSGFAATSGSGPETNPPWPRYQRQPFGKLRVRRLPPSIQPPRHCDYALSYIASADRRMTRSTTPARADRDDGLCAARSRQCGRGARHRRHQGPALVAAISMELRHRDARTPPVCRRRPVPTRSCSGSGLMDFLTRTRDSSLGPEQHIGRARLTCYRSRSRVESAAQAPPQSPIPQRHRSPSAPARIRASISDRSRARGPFGAHLEEARWRPS